MTVADFLDEYAAATGSHWLMSRRTREALETQRVAFLGRLQVPTAQVHAFAQAVLRAQRVAIVPVRTGEPRLLRAVSLGADEDGQARRHALDLPRDRLDELHGLSATLVSTMLELTSIDASQLASSLPSIRAAYPVHEIVWDGRSDSVVVVGFVDDVRAIVRQLRSLDRAAARTLASVESVWIRLEHARAQELAQALDDLISQAAAAQHARPYPARAPDLARAPDPAHAYVWPRVLVDVRTNSLVVRALSTDLRLIVPLIQMLDVPLRPESGDSESES